MKKKTSFEYSKLQFQLNKAKRFNIEHEPFEVEDNSFAMSVCVIKRTIHWTNSSICGVSYPGCLKKGLQSCYLRMLLEEGEIPLSIERRKLLCLLVAEETSCFAPFPLLLSFTRKLACRDENAAKLLIALHPSVWSSSVSYTTDVICHENMHLKFFPLQIWDQLEGGCIFCSRT